MDAKVGVPYVEGDVMGKKQEKIIQYWYDETKRLRRVVFDTEAQHDGMLDVKNQEIAELRDLVVNQALALNV